MVTIIEQSEGCILSVRAMPGARRTGVQGEQAGALKVAVTAPAQDGRANKALIETLHQALGLKRSQIGLLSGEASRDKKFLISDMTKTELEARIMALLA